jgi:hypothetical protein
MTGRTRGTTTPAPGRSRTPASAAYRAYHWALGLFLLLGAVQIFLAGLGAFSAGGGPGFEPHRLNGYIMSGVALVIVVLAVVARAGARHIAAAVVLLLLVGLMQSLLAAGGWENAWIGGLHALDGLVIIGVADYHFGASPPGRGPVGAR